MTTNRGRLGALTKLLALQAPGAFELPQQLLDAADLPRRVAGLPMPEPSGYTLEAAADELLAGLRAGRTVPGDLDGCAARLAEVAIGGKRRELAAAIVRNAHEQAEAMAVNVAADLADAVIVECLRPTFVALLAEVDGHATTLKGHALDDRSLITAPAKVRTSWLKLRDLAERYAAIREALTQVNVAGFRVPQHDIAAEYLLCEHPERLTGHTPGTARAPRLDQLADDVRYPTSDPIALMLWTVGPGKRAGLWLPTTQQQDARWLEVYGEAQQQRVNAAAGARGLVAT